MDEKIEKLLYDIHNSINLILEFVGEPKVFETYKNDKKTRSAFERHIAIIGEAINKIQSINNEIQIQNTKQIIGLRNRIIHAYDSIDDTIIWAIIINQLPKLKTEIENLLNI